MKTTTHTPDKKHFFIGNLKRQSIRIQLMLFLCSTSLITLLLIWALSSYLLQPVYNAMIRNHLENQLEKIITLMDETTAEGVLISTREDGTLLIDTGFQDAFYHAVSSEEISLSDLCVNIADTTLSYVMYSENVYPCLLHSDVSTLFGEETLDSVSRDNDTTIALREQCFSEGDVFAILTVGEWQQMLVGQTTTDGTYTVFVSASLSQVTDASIVLHAISPIVSVIVLLLAILTAWFFSLWFATPISTLTKATHRIASGDYNIQVPATRNNELGELSESFNTMAKEVRRSAELQNELLSNISHDLRTPLTLIRGYAETVRDITGEKKEKREDAMNIIIDETNRLTNLVNGILELSKVNAGVEKLTATHFDFVEFSARFADRYQGVCRQNNCQLIVDMPATPLPIFADTAMLERVIDNLLSNAMRHIGADNIFVLRARLDDAGHCRIEVEDHGIGIPPEELSFLFKRYYRTRNDAGKQGMGLGLSIVRAILDKHGFAYGVDSVLGEGTTFWFVAHNEFI